MKNQSWDQRVSVVVAALTEYLVRVRIVLPAVNLDATVKRSNSYHVTRKHASNQLAPISASVLAFRASILCLIKASYPQSE
jgi:hypothetical protein